MRTIILAVIAVASAFAGTVTYTFDTQSTVAPINPIHFSIVASDYITTTGPFAISPFVVTDSLGDSWTLNASFINEPGTHGSCFDFGGGGAVIGECQGRVINRPFSFISVFYQKSPLTTPLPTADGVYSMQLDYALGTSGADYTLLTIPATLTVSSAPEPGTASGFIVAFLAAAFMVKKQITKAVRV